MVQMVFDDFNIDLSAAGVLDTKVARSTFEAQRLVVYLLPGQTPAVTTHSVWPLAMEQWLRTTGW